MVSASESWPEADTDRRDAGYADASEDAWKLLLDFISAHRCKAATQHQVIFDQDSGIEGFYLKRRETHHK